MTKEVSDNAIASFVSARGSRWGSHRWADLKLNVLLALLLAPLFGLVILASEWTTISAPYWLPAADATPIYTAGVIVEADGFFGLEVEPGQFIDLGCTKSAFHQSECGRSFKHLLSRNIGRQVSLTLIDADKRSNSDYVLMALRDYTGAVHTRGDFAPRPLEALKTTLLRWWFILAIFTVVSLCGGWRNE